MEPEIAVTLKAAFLGAVAMEVHITPDQLTRQSLDLYDRYRPKADVRQWPFF